MPLSPPPAFVGQINITSNNNEIYWSEGATHLNATITLDGLQYVSDLLEHIATKMTTESAASGSSYTYTGSFSIETGKVTISSTGNFAIRNTTSQTGAVWSGGDSDSNGDAYTNEQYGTEHLGFPKVAITSLSTSHTGTNPTSSYFSPSQPIYQDNEDPFDAMVSFAKAEGGTVKAYDFTPVYEATGDFLGGGFNADRRVFLGNLTDDDRDQYRLNFWRQNRARPFKFYKDRTDSANREYQLQKESAQKSGFNERLSGVRRWQGEILMTRTKVE